MSAKTVRDILAEAKIDIEKLPKIQHNPDKKIYREEMTHAMQVGEAHNKDYIVMAICGHGNEKITSFKGNPPVNKLKGTLQFYLDHDFYVVENPQDIAAAYNCYHDKNGHSEKKSINECPTCPIRSGNKFHPYWFHNLLAGKDPLFKIQL